MPEQWIMRGIEISILYIYGHPYVKWCSEAFCDCLIISFLDRSIRFGYYGQWYCDSSPELFFDPLKCRSNFPDRLQHTLICVFITSSLFLTFFNRADTPKKTIPAYWTFNLQEFNLKVHIHSYFSILRYTHMQAHTQTVSVACCDFCITWHQCKRCDQKGVI